MTKPCLLAGLLALVASGCAGRQTAPSPSPTGAGSTPSPAMTVPASRRPVAPHTGVRVAVVVMENKEYATVAGNPNAPYLNGLVPSSALATSYYAVSHPSLPNYLALIGGDTFGISSDCTGCHVNALNLVDQLDEAHVSWKAYMEDMPRACFTGGSAGRYAKKHNPFVYFDDIVSNPSRCANVVPLSALHDAALPDFVWITPDLCNDTHDCSVATGDRFLARLLPPLIRALGPRGVVFVTYDEGSSGAHGGGHVFTLATGPGVRPGRYDQAFDHYALLRTIEDVFGLRHLARASEATSMTPLLR